MFFIHSSADRHFGCFHVLAIVNSAAMNIGIYVSFQIMVFWGSYLYFLLIRYYLKGHLWVGLLYWTGQAQNISSLSLYSPHAWLIVFQPPCEAQCAGSNVTTSHPSPTLESGFPCGSSGQESACNAGDLDSIPGFERSPGEGKAYPLQYSGLENSMDCLVHGVAKSQTQLSDFHFQLYRG